MLVTGQRRGTPYFPSAARSLRLWPRGRALRWIPSFRNSPSDSGRARTAHGAGIREDRTHEARSGAHTRVCMRHGGTWYTRC